MHVTRLFACQTYTQIKQRLLSSTWGMRLRGSYRQLFASVRPAGEACWWTIHPASKQRSEGEKVRVGDDLILVSVSSERYLVRLPVLHPSCSDINCAMLNSVSLCLLCPQHLSYASGDLMVDASFMQTLWNMNPITSGCELAEGTNLLKHSCRSQPNTKPHWSTGMFSCSSKTASVRPKTKAAFF